MKIKKYAIVIIILVFVAGSDFLLSGKFDKKVSDSFHTLSERNFFLNHVFSPIDSGEFFLHSTRCEGCHGSDTLGLANINAAGEDINLFDDWRSTMMANSAIDPLWRAKVSHEILVDPGHAAALQDKCTSCHAPMGHFTSVFKGNPHYNIQTLDTDSLGLNGVACGGCHEIGTNQLGGIFSGNIPYDTTRKEFGPFFNPQVGPMQLYVGLIPTYSTHTDEGRFCSPCHTLLTNSTDLNGNLTGRTFIEQATYHEWENSDLPADNVVCQRCHMPQVTDSIVIANGILNLPPRSPFNRHKFTGANLFMIQMIKDYKSTLGISTPDKYFDSTLAATTRLLRQSTLDLHLSFDSLTADSAFIKLRLTNKAGHKFPSGYPSRRAVVQLLVIDQNHDTVFSSGLFDPQFEVIGIDTIFERHHQVINRQNEVQVYEMVMGDVNGNKTTVLERADTVLKDNRLTPEGFLTSSPVYDTVRIVGEATTDPDFNKDSLGHEGTGCDIIHYHIPVSGHTGTFKIYANVFYQAVPPAWLHEMFSYHSAPIDTFRAMYVAENRAPFLVGSDSINVLSVFAGSPPPIRQEIVISPNPTSDGWVNISIPANQNLKKMNIFDTHGNPIIFDTIHKKYENVNVHLPAAPGIYLLIIETDNQRAVKKIIRD